MLIACNIYVVCQIEVVYACAKSSVKVIYTLVQDLKHNLVPTEEVSLNDGRKAPLLKSTFNGESVAKFETKNPAVVIQFR